MMRYYFDLREGSDLAVDEEGSQFLSVEAAQEEAALSLANMARDAVTGIFSGSCQPMQVEVRDERGPLFQLGFDFGLRMSRH